MYVLKNLTNLKFWTPNLGPQTWNFTTKLKLEYNLGVPVYLKLENLQVPGSFKIRGIGLTCQIAKENGFKRLVGSSGGNAGLAMAYAANQLKMPITLFIPTSTPEMMVNLIKVS